MNDDNFTSGYAEEPDFEPERTALQQQPKPQPSDSGQQGRVVDFTASDTTGPGKSGHDFETEPRHRHRGRKFLVWIITLAVIALGVTFYLRYCNPYVAEAHMQAYVTGVEKRGMLFKTNEAQLISREAVTDTVHLYTHALSLSVASDSLVGVLRSYQGTGRPVTIVYERYYGSLPWRGASTGVITAVNP